jgi:trehalose/maltose hydrolase-like predicted phosphorylase
MLDKAYDYFMSTATVDLSGAYRRYVGTLYIGGTHPGANGGAWMAVVQGFAGLQFDGATLTIAPALPAHWQRVAFTVIVRGQSLQVEVSRDAVQVTAAPENTMACEIVIAGRRVRCGQGESVSMALE